VRVLICPDKFAGSLSAREVAAAVGEGWASAAPHDDIITRPLSDGGPGFVDALKAATDGQVRLVEASDPLDRPVQAQVLVAGPTAYVESAQTCGLHLLAPGERDATITTSYGLGRVVAALEVATEVVVGLGGSATNDAGAGMLAALGAVSVDATGERVPRGGLALARCDRLAGRPHIGRLVAATDVDNPLTGPSGATYVYGPQKGVDPHDLATLDAALARFAGVLERDLPGCPGGLASLPGAGAAGGIGAAILACGGRRVSGFGLVRRLTGLDAVMAHCDLVVTGEGSFDDQSMRGKVVVGVAAAAAERGVPCVVLAGRVNVDERVARPAGITAAYSLVDELGSVEEALRRPAEGLRALGARLALHKPSPDRHDVA
jgi:glycerate kinase